MAVLILPSLSAMTAVLRVTLTLVFSRVPTMVKKARRSTPKLVLGFLVVAMVWGQPMTRYEAPDSVESVDSAVDGTSSEASLENTPALDRGLN